MIANVPKTLARRALTLAPALLLAACASTRLDSEWRDPQLTARGANGTRLLVACSADDEAVKRLCEDKLRATLSQQGVTTLGARDLPAPANATDAAAYVAPARAAGASGVLFTRVSPSTYGGGSRSSVGIGLGGWGGGNVGFGIGVGVPIGERPPETVLVASTTLLESAQGRTVWAASATSRRSGKVPEQLDDLAGTLATGLSKAGVL